MQSKRKAQSWLPAPRPYVPQCHYGSLIDFHLISCRLCLWVELRRVVGTIVVDRKHTLKALTIVIPALNEAGKIAATVEEVLPLARELLSDFEILLVNDGSTDETGAIMDEVAARHAHMTVIHHAQRRGLSS